MVATFTCPICLTERVCPNVVADDNEILADESVDNCNTEEKQDIHLVVLGNERAETIQDHPQSAQIVAADEISTSSNHAESHDTAALSSGHDTSDMGNQLFSEICSRNSDNEQDDIDDQNSMHDQDIPSVVTNQKYGDEIFELSSCNHKFCTPCLRAYVRSKLLDGIVDIPCCHFGKLSSLEEDFHPCNVLLEESDIYNLIHMGVDDCDESNNNNNIDEWRCSNIKDDHHKCSSTSNIKRKPGGNELWTKYQKLKFDIFHGKDVVRRCPQCDHAQLFDEDSMKRYQTTYLTNIAAQTSVAGDASNAADNTNFLESVRDAFRQRRRNNAGGSREDTDANTHEQGDVSGEIESTEIGLNLPVVGTNELCKEESAEESQSKENAAHGNLSNATTTSEAAIHAQNLSCAVNILHQNRGARQEVSDSDDESMPPLEDIDGILLSSDAKIDENDKEGGTSASMEGKMDASSSVVAKSEECKQEEDSSLAHDKANELCVECKESEQSEQPSNLGKSTTPIVTCQKCNTDFCYFHSNAHAGNVSSCIEYHKKSLETNRANIEYATNTLRAKSCPTCGISVSKEGGCNQMKCGSCGTHFCWLCGVIVDDGAFPEHFRWW